jgi:hypothetical protein
MECSESSVALTLCFRVALSHCILGCTMALSAEPNSKTEGESYPSIDPYAETPHRALAQEKGNAHRKVASRRAKVIEADGREPQSPETLKETPPKINRRISTYTLPVPKEN